MYSELSLKSGQHRFLSWQYLSQLHGLQQLKSLREDSLDIVFIVEHDCSNLHAFKTALKTSLLEQHKYIN